MSTETIYKCDNCHDQCENGFFNFKDATIRQANGRRKDKVYGYRDLKIEDKIFCSLDCLQEFLELKTERGDDYFMPGDQVGVLNPTGITGK